MRQLALRVASVLAAGACTGGSATRATTPAAEAAEPARAAFADDEVEPTYEPADLQQALTAERAALAAAEQRVRELAEAGDSDRLRTARGDAEVRRRFVASLESCAATGRLCPPRLDEPAWRFDVEGSAEPALDVPLRFDLASWRNVAAELHGRACACRTLACVDSLFVAIDRLETRPMPDVRADEAASLSITHARDCLYRLRGLRATPRAIATE